MGRIVRLTESDLNRLVRRVIREQQNGNTSKFKVITNNWSEFPPEIEPSTLTGQWGGAAYIRNHNQEKMPELKNVITTDNDKMTCCMFESNGIVYLFLYEGMHTRTPQSCTIEKGTAEEYSKYYSNAKSMVTSLPEGATDYILIRPQDKKMSSLVILKNGKTCFTWALPEPGYPPFKNCQ